jgi:hypothetical protein
MVAGYTIGEYEASDSRADDYMVALGRAMHIATVFEHKSRGLVTTLRTIEGLGPIFHYIEDIDDLFGVGTRPEPKQGDMVAEEWSLREAAAAAKTARQPLAHVLERLCREVYDDPHGIEKLREARAGRNWVAHNAGLIFLQDHQHWTQGHFLRSFRNAVLLIAYADALVSEWTWIEPDCWHSVGPPKEYSEVYPELVVTWVFEKIWDLVPTDDLPSWKPHAGGPYQRLQERLESGR